MHHQFNRKSSSESILLMAESSTSVLPPKHVERIYSTGTRTHRKSHSPKPTVPQISKHRVNAASNPDIKSDDLPNPVPDTGRSSSKIVPTTLFVHPGFIPTARPSSTIIAVGQNPAHTATSASTSTDPNYSPFPSFPPRKHAQNTSDNRILIVIFGSVGGVFVLIVVFVLYRIQRRPRRRMHPTPSLPVLQDVFEDKDRPIAEGSPVFGGRERFSPTLGRGEKEKWTWTQYQSKLPTTAQQGDIDIRDLFADPLEKGNYLHPKTAQPPARKQPSLLSRSFSRFSAISAYSTSKSEAAGLLASRISPFTADPFEDRPKLRNSYRRDRNTVRISVRDCDAPILARQLDNYLYGGNDLTPVIQPPVAIASSGRQRIKAPYPVGSCPSMNSISPFVAPSTSFGIDPFEDAPFVATPFIKTEARRERDTQALTAALGLPSPSRSSIGRSHIYLGMEDDRSTIPGSPLDTGLRLGNLMMSEYASTPLPPVTPLRTARTRIVDDKAPMVPLPPALPSLAQMAMSGNDMDYDNYRSPTYSLYDIYANRKSVYGGKVDHPKVS